MLLDSMLNMTNEAMNYEDFLFTPLHEADDFGDGTGPSNDDDQDDYEVSDDNGGDNNQEDNSQDTNNDNSADTQSNDGGEDDYEIQDDDSQQSNVNDSGDDTSTQSDDQNTGDTDGDEDYEIQDDDSQDSQGQDDNQNTGDDQSGGDEDDYEVSDDGGDDSGDDAGTDSSDISDNNGDADSSGGDMDSADGGDDPRAKLNELEKSIFDQLSPDQQQAKTLELKGLFQMAYNNCQKIIDSISTTESNPTTAKVFDYIVGRLTDLKGYITDYLSDVFDSKGYLENMTEFQKYLAIFDTIKNTFDDIQKEKSAE